MAATAQRAPVAGCMAACQFDHSDLVSMIPMALLLSMSAACPCKLAQKIMKASAKTAHMMPSDWQHQKLIPGLSALHSRKTHRFWFAGGVDFPDCLLEPAVPENGLQIQIYAYTSHAQAVNSFYKEGHRLSQLASSMHVPKRCRWVLWSWLPTRRASSSASGIRTGSTVRRKGRI